MYTAARRVGEMLRQPTVLFPVRYYFWAKNLLRRQVGDASLATA